MSYNILQWTIKRRRQLFRHYDIPLNNGVTYLTDVYIGEYPLVDKIVASRWESNGYCKIWDFLDENWKRWREVEPSIKYFKATVKWSFIRISHFLLVINPRDIVVTMELLVDLIESRACKSISSWVSSLRNNKAVKLYENVHENICRYPLQLGIG